MDTLLEAANVLSSVALILAMIATPVLFWWGRKLFVEQGTVLTKAETTTAVTDSEKRTAEALQDYDHRIRDHFQSVVGNMQNTATQRHEQVTRELRDLKDDVRAALARSNDAHDRAAEAEAQANRAWDRSGAVEKRLEDQISTTNASLARIEKAVARGNNG